MKVYIFSGQKKLSGFYPNDIPGVFAFRRNDFYCFNTWSEANNFIVKIQDAVNDPENVKRYGDRYAKKHQSIARNLKIRSSLI